MSNAEWDANVGEVYFDKKYLTVPINYKIKRFVEDGIPLEVALEVQSIPGCWATVGGFLTYPWTAEPVVLNLFPGLPEAPPPKWGPILPNRESFRGIFRDIQRPHAYQLEEIALRVRWGGGYTWSSPGSGKTMMGLGWALAMTRVCRSPILWVGLPSTTEQTADAVREWAAEATPIVLRPPSRRRGSGQDDLEQQLLRAPHQPIVISSWTQLRDESAQRLIEKLRFKAVIYDETQFAKSPPVQYTPQVDWSLAGKKGPGDEEMQVKRQVRQAWDMKTKPTVSGQAHLLAAFIPYRLGLTATPGDADRGDLQPQLSLIETQGWGNSPRRFLLRYCGAVSHPHAPPDRKALTIDVRHGAYGPTQKEEFWERLNGLVSLIPYERSHGHLPPATRRVILVPKNDLDPPLDGQVQRRRQLLRLMEYQDDAKARGELREVDYEIAAEQAQGFAMGLVRQYMNVGKGKIILFTGRRKLVDKQESALKRMGFELFLATSDLDPKEVRKLALAYYKSPGPSVWLSTYDKGGTGLDGLQDTDMTLFQMAPPRLALFEQALGRADRTNRTRATEGIFLIPEGSQVEKDIRHAADLSKTVADVHAGSRLATLHKDLALRGDDENLLEGLAALLLQSHVE